MAIRYYCRKQRLRPTVLFTGIKKFSVDYSL